MSALEELTNELRDKCQREGWPERCATELLHELYDKDEARHWLEDFIERWDRAEALEPPRVIGAFREEGEDDGYGGSFTRYAVCEVPFDWNDERIADWVRGHFPAYRCAHEYDCCGNYYPSSADWSVADVDARLRQYVRENEGEKQRPMTILVRQGWGQNV